MDTDDFFAQLDAEIAAVTSKAKLRADREAAKKRANTMTLSQSARKRAAEDFHELSRLLEAEEWRSVSTTALFTEQTCDGCGSVHRTFLQFMEVQAQVKRPTSIRWVRVTKPCPELPRTIMAQYATTHICADCCDEHGFDWTYAETAPRVKDLLALSPTYVQEDINAPSA